MSNQLYLLPVLTVTFEGGPARGPKYYWWFGNRLPPDGTGLPRDRMVSRVYGFLPSALVYVTGVADVDHTFVSGQADTYTFPATLDDAITDPTLDPFFEALHIPTDWLTPSTTYRQLLRNMEFIFQFSRRYAVLSGVNAALLGEGGVSLDTNYNQIGTDRKAWFDATLISFGAPPVTGNPKLRALLRSASSVTEDQPFTMGNLITI